MEEDDIIEEETADEQQTIRDKRIAQLRPYQWKKGQSGNALGRYLGGKSGKERARAMIASMTDDEFEDFMEGMNKKDIWEMGEGKAETKTDITTKGESINPVLVKFLNGKDETTKDDRDTTGV